MTQSDPEIGSGLPPRAAEVEPPAAVLPAGGPTEGDSVTTPFVQEWRCYFCDALFTDKEDARLHFGADEDQQPACQIKGSEGGLVRALREAEDALFEATCRLHAESADGIQAYRGHLSRQAGAVRSAEEAGYARGLADGRMFTIQGDGQSRDAGAAPGDGWPDDWKLYGFNGAIRQAQEALRYLATNDRPIGGEQFPNAGCCYTIAAELELTRQRYAAFRSLHKAAARAHAAPTHEAGEVEHLREAFAGLEVTEDGYSLRTPYDGDADGDGRPIVVGGGDVVVTFADSDEGDRIRMAVAKVLGLVSEGAEQ